MGLPGAAGSPPLEITDGSTSVAFTPVAEDIYSVVSINDEVVANGALYVLTDLQGGDKLITVQVTSANGMESKSYHITISKHLSSFTVSFDFMVSGQPLISKTVPYQGKVADPPSYTRPGYTFAGWYSDSAFSTDSQWDFDNDVVTGNITLYAKWTPSNYAVSFDSQEGSPCEDIVVTYDKSYGSLPTSTRTGFSFAGWYTQLPGGDLVVNETIVAIANDHTLYARWAPNSRTVIFNSQGGTAVAAKTAQYNTTITAPTPPTRSDYSFQGWYKELSCTTAWDFATDTVTTDITLYAKWVSTTPIGVKAASASYTSATVSWTAVPGATGYQVYRSTSSTGTYALAGTVTGTSFTNTGLSTGTTYCYKVRSYTGATKVYSAFSSIVTAKPVPAAPTSPKATPATYNSIKVTWAAVSGATKYEVYRATYSTGTYALLTTTSYT